jgi:hypothetical protein
MDIGSIRADLWREAAEDRSRDEEVAKAVEAVAAALQTVLAEEQEEEARDAADLLWAWAERAVLILGLAVSAWVSKGGLLRVWRRWRSASAPKVEQSVPEPPPVVQVMQHLPPVAFHQAAPLPPPYHQAAAQLLQHQQQPHPDPAYWG